MSTEAHQHIDQPIPWTHPELLPEVDRKALYRGGEEIVLDVGDATISPLIPGENIARDGNTKKVVAHVNPDDLRIRLEQVAESERGQQIDSFLNVALSNTSSLLMLYMLRPKDIEPLDFARTQFGLISTLVHHPQLDGIIGQEFVKEVTSLGKQIEEVSSRLSRRQVL